MKIHLFKIVAILLILAYVNVYSLNNFYFKTIALDKSGQILPNSIVEVRVTIDSSLSKLLYQEIHTGITTDQFGSIVIEIGSGTVVSGNFAIISTKADTRITIETMANGANWVLSTIETLSESSNSSMNYINNFVWMLKGNTGTTPGINFLGTTDDKELRIEVRNDNTVKNSLRMDNNQSVFRETGIHGITLGNARGQYAVDLQIYRSAASKVASGKYSFIGGGGDNTASGIYSFVGGGFSNTASGYGAMVGSGDNNFASEKYATVTGGYHNTASGSYSTVTGGLFNTAHGDASVIYGGGGNNSNGFFSMVGGGLSNLANGDASVVNGGENNQANGKYSTVIGGSHNTAPSYAETVVGLYSTNYIPNSSTSFDSDDRLFNIGNGTSTNRSDAFTIYKSGNAILNGKLTVNDVIKLTPRSSPPASLSIGDIYMDDGTNTSNGNPKLMVYDGTTWQECW